MFKKHFPKFFIFFLVILASISLRIYLNNGRENYINRADNRYEVANKLTNDIVETAMAVYNQYHSDYEWIVYPSDDAYINSSIENAFSITLDQIFAERINEKGLAFNVYDGDKLLGEKQEIDIKNSIIYRSIYIEDDNIYSDDDYGLKYFEYRHSDASWLSNNFVNRLYDSSILRAPYDYFEDCEINFPDGLRIDFSINNDISMESELYSALMANSYNLPFMIMIAIIVISICLVLIMIFIPHRYFNNLKTFNFFRNFYVGPFFIIYLFLMAFGGFGLVIATTSILNGEAYTLLARLSIINYGFAINLLLTLAYMAWFYMVIVGIDYVKEMFCYGFGDTMKERTLTANIFKAIYNTLTKIFSFDFSNRTFVKLALLIIALYVLIVFIPTAIFAYQGFLGFVFASVIFGILVVVILVQYNHYRNDYEILLKNTNGVASVGFKDYNFIEIDSFKEVQDELKNIREVIKKAVAEETKSQNMKTELITNVSHDLKTPITGMRNYLELLQDPNLSEDKRKEYIEIINNYNNRLNRLVRDLFEVSKVNAGEYNLELMDLDVVALVHQTLVECEDSFEEKGLVSIVNTNKDKINLKLDGDKTYRIFENLLINISKYALANTRVYVDITEEDDYVDIIFKNISEVRIDMPVDKLTERFVRGDKSRSQSGSGLGLAIATSFTEIQNGKFEIQTDGDLFKAKVRFYKK